MSLISWQGAKVIAPALATGWYDPFYGSFYPNHKILIYKNMNIIIVIHLIFSCIFISLIHMKRYGKDIATIIRHKIYSFICEMKQYTDIAVQQ